MRVVNKKEQGHLSSVSVFVRGRKYYKLLVIEVNVLTCIMASIVVKPYYMNCNMCGSECGIEMRIVSTQFIFVMWS